MKKSSQPKTPKDRPRSARGGAVVGDSRAASVSPPGVAVRAGEELSPPPQVIAPVVARARPTNVELGPAPPVPRASIFAHLAVLLVALPFARAFAETLAPEGFARKLILAGSLVAVGVAFELRRRAGSGTLPGEGAVALQRRASRAAWLLRSREAGLSRTALEFERGSIEGAPRTDFVLPMRVAAGLAFVGLIAGAVSSSLAAVAFFTPLAALALAWERALSLSPRALAPLALGAARASARRARSGDDFLAISRAWDFLSDAALLGAFALGWYCLHLPVAAAIRTREEAGRGLPSLDFWLAWVVGAAVVGLGAGYWMIRRRTAYADRERAELAEALRDALVAPD